jgi:hypothetical protein
LLNSDNRKVDAALETRFFESFRSHQEGANNRRDELANAPFPTNVRLEFSAHLTIKNPSSRSMQRSSIVSTLAGPQPIGVPGWEMLQRYVFEAKTLVRTTDLLHRYFRRAKH